MFNTQKEAQKPCVIVGKQKFIKKIRFINTHNKVNKSQMRLTIHELLVTIITKFKIQNGVGEIHV